MSDITQSSVTLTWSIGDTHHVDSIQLFKREYDASGSAAGPWLTPTNASSVSSHTVTSLTPGTTYDFYVRIESYGNTDETAITTVTTGATDIAALHTY